MQDLAVRQPGIHPSHASRRINVHDVDSLHNWQKVSRQRSFVALVPGIPSHGVHVDRVRIPSWQHHRVDLHQIRRLRLFIQRA